MNSLIYSHKSLQENCDHMETTIVQLPKLAMLENLLWTMQLYIFTKHAAEL